MFPHQIEIKYLQKHDGKAKTKNHKKWKGCFPTQNSISRNLYIGACQIDHPESRFHNKSQPWVDQQAKDLSEIFTTVVSNHEKFNGKLS